MRTVLKYIFAVILTLQVIFVSNAQESKSLNGGLARTAAMGGGPTNPYIMDYSDIFINPAYASKYNDLFYSDLGYSFASYSAAGQTFGWTMAMDNLSWGINIGHREGPMFAENSYGTGSFSESDNMVGALDSYLSSLSFESSSEPMAPFQLYGSMKMNNMTLGLAIYRAGWSSSDDGYSVLSKQKLDMSNNQTGIKLGMLMESSSDMSLDASLLFRLNGSSAEFTDGNTGASPSAAKYDASGTELGINARMFYKWSEKMTLVPLLRFTTFGYEPEVTSTPSPAIANTKPDKYGRSEFELGIGDNIKMESGMVTVGMSVQSISLTHDVTSIVGTDLKTTKQTR